MSWILLFAILLASAGSAGSQSTALSGAVTGYIYDAPSRSVRPVVGFPGSSYLGREIVPDLEDAFVAPDGNSALVIGKAGVALVRGLRTGGLSTDALSQVTDRIDFVAWASGAARLVAYSSSTRRLLRMDLNTAPPQASFPIDLSDIDGDVAHLTTNRDASETVIAVRHAERGGLYAVAESGAAWLLAPMASAGTAVFNHSSNELYATDSAGREIIRFSRGIYGSAEVLSLPVDSAQTVDALAAAGQKIYLGCGAARVIREFDLNSRTLTDIPLDFIPERFEPLNASGSVFALTQRRTREQPLWLLDIRGTPGVFFVPAGE